MSFSKKVTKCVLQNYLGQQGHPFASGQWSEVRVAQKPVLLVPFYEHDLLSFLAGPLNILCHKLNLPLFTQQTFPVVL
jgi:hypothetical protein